MWHEQLSTLQILPPIYLNPWPLLIHNRKIFHLCKHNRLGEKSGEMNYSLSCITKDAFFKTDFIYTRPEEGSAFGPGCSLPATSPLHCTLTLIQAAQRGDLCFRPPHYTRATSEHTGAYASPADIAHSTAVAATGGLGGIDASPAVADCSQHLGFQAWVHAV